MDLFLGSCKNFETSTFVHKITNPRISKVSQSPIGFSWKQTGHIRPQVEQSIGIHKLLGSHLIC